MTRRQVWQYRCEFCGKQNLSASSISKHEKRCVKNPDRECSMCRLKAEVEREDPKTAQVPLSELIECIDISLPDEGLKRLRDACDDCPTCTLAALLHCGAHRPGYTLTYPSHIAQLAIGLPASHGFHFKAACKDWWDYVNDCRNGGDYY